MADLEKILREVSYPGRGITIGRSADGKKAVIAYFIMGRSSNSRNTHRSVYSEIRRSSQTATRQTPSMTALTGR